MKTLDVYNLLDGETLCNIFASLIVNKIKEQTPDSKTEISVINVRSFFIVKGRTTSDIVVTNPSEILQEFLSQYSEVKSNSVRVIDIIEYSKPFDLNNLNINYEFDKVLDKSLKEEQNFINSFISDQVYFNYKINYVLNTIFFDCESGYESLVKERLSERFMDYEIIKSDFSQEIYKSERIYGISNIPEKSYHLLLKNISYTLFNLGISKKLNLLVQSNLNYEDVDCLNVFFKISNDDHIVKTDWLESLILDVFPFNLKELNNYFDVKNYNPLDELLNDDVKCTWKNLSSVKDIILV